MIDPIELHAYVDGELDRERADEIRRRLPEASSDAREVEAIRGLKAMMQTKTEAPVSAEAWRSCVKRLDELDQARRVERVVGRFAPALCGVLFVCIVLAGRFTTHHDRSTVTGPDLALTLGSSEPSSQSASWLEALIRQSRLSTPDHLVVLHGDHVLVNGYDVDAFRARDANGNLTIMEFPPGVELEGMLPFPGRQGLSLGSLNGVNCVAKDQGGKTVLIAAERSYEDLADVAAHVAVK